MSGTTARDETTVTVAGAGIRMLQRGEGEPVLFLHPHIGMEHSEPFLDELARGRRVYAPCHPGFGESERPKGMSSIDEVSYLYLELLRVLDLHDVLLAGASLGGWIAMSMAIKCQERLSGLALIDPVGVKFGPRDKLDVADLYSIPESKFVELAYHDPKYARRDYEAMPEEDLIVVARNRETTARFAWSPYMYDPKLRRLLYRISVPTLVLWGSSDRFAPLQYAKHYADAIPGARLREIPNAGHFPHVEQPAATARALLDFCRRA